MALFDDDNGILLDPQSSIMEVIAVLCALPTCRQLIMRILNPFQTQAAEDNTAGITEMLMQSYDGDIHLLPALPSAWPSGSIKGMIARGGFIINMDWNKGKITNLTITSKLGGNCRLRLPDALKAVGFTLKPAVGVNSNPLYAVNAIKQPLIANPSALKGLTYQPTELFDFETLPGKTYVLKGM